MNSGARDYLKSILIDLQQELRSNLIDEAQQKVNTCKAINFVKEQTGETVFHVVDKDIDIMSTFMLAGVVVKNADQDDREIRIIVDDIFFNLTHEEQIVILLHEVGHLKLGHATQSRSETRRMLVARERGLMPGIQPEIDADNYAIDLYPEGAIHLLKLLIDIQVNTPEESATYFEQKLRIENLFSKVEEIIEHKESSYDQI